MTHDEIQQEIRQLHEDKDRYIDMIMESYNNTTFYPNLEKLQSECEKIGHVEGEPEHGLYSTLTFCIHCRKRMREID